MIPSINNWGKFNIVFHVTQYYLFGFNVWNLFVMFSVLLLFRLSSQIPVPAGEDLVSLVYFLSFSTPSLSHL